MYIFLLIALILGLLAMCIDEFNTKLRGTYKVVYRLSYTTYYIFNSNVESEHNLIFLENEFGDRYVDGRIPKELSNTIFLWKMHKINTEELESLIE